MLDPSISRAVDRSRRYLDTARMALDNGDPESAASRAYYALYHITILLLRVVRRVERRRWDHEQLHHAFLDEFCKPGFRFDRRDGDDWRYVKESRIDADYSRQNVTDASRARRALDRAEHLVEKMRMEVGWSG